MKKPFAMIQIVNHLLPPKILNNQGANISANTKSLVQTYEGDLFPPNSFYVQAHMFKNYIDFTLNKVIDISVLSDTVQKSKFTVKERRVSMNNIVDLACHNMWYQFILLDSEEYEDEQVLNLCKDHCNIDLSHRNYRHFYADMKQFLKNGVI